MEQVRANVDPDAASPPESRPTLGRDRAAAPVTDSFVRALVAGDDAEAARHVEALRLQGATLETLCAGLLEPAAHRLGLHWERDTATFGEVTLALRAMTALFEDQAARFPSAVGAPDRGRRALLLPAPGEHHTLGLALVREYFRRDGWQVVGGSAESWSALARRVSTEPFDVVGLAVGSDARLPSLAGGIRALRRASCNARLKVLVGGPRLAERPDLAAQLGADGTAGRAGEAPQVAGRILEAGSASATR